jgi:hypothetical protein
VGNHRGPWDDTWLRSMVGHRRPAQCEPAANSRSLPNPLRPHLPGCVVRLLRQPNGRFSKSVLEAFMMLWNAAPQNKGMKQTSVEHIGRSQLIPGVRQTVRGVTRTNRQCIA